MCIQFTTLCFWFVLVHSDFYSCFLFGGLPFLEVGEGTAYLAYGILVPDQGLNLALAVRAPSPSHLAPGTCWVLPFSALSAMNSHLVDFTGSRDFADGVHVCESGAGRALVTGLSAFMVVSKPGVSGHTWPKPDPWCLFAGHHLRDLSSRRSGLQDGRGEVHPRTGAELPVGGPHTVSRGLCLCMRVAGPLGRWSEWAELRPPHPN